MEGTSENNGSADVSREQTKKKAKKRKFETSHWCPVCNIQIPSGTTLQHNGTKKHLNAVNQRVFKLKTMKEVSKGGICISGVPETISTEIVVDHFKQYGPVLAYQKTPTERGADFIIQFRKNFNVHRAVLKEAHVVEGTHLTVQPRKLPNWIENDAKAKPSAEELRDKVKEVLEAHSCSPVSEQLAALVAGVESTELEAAHHAQIIESLEHWLSLEYPGCRLRPFGSAVSGLAFRSSDLDVFLDLSSGKKEAEEIEDPDVWRARMLVVLKEANLVLLSHPDVAESFLVSQARIPVIKFVHAPTGVNCDVSCNNTIGVRNSALIRSFQAVDPRVRPFMMILKLWAKSQRFISAPESTLSSYALCLLAVFYLQQVSILPSVESLQRDEPVQLRNGWNVAFRQPSSICDITDESSVFDLLVGFFRFYREFDSTTDVVCPLLGRPVPRSDFDALYRLPDSMALYVQKVREDKVTPFRYSAISVQDPFELSHNVSFGFRLWEVFRSQCAKAEQLTPGNLLELFIPPVKNKKKKEAKCTEKFKLRFKSEDKETAPEEDLQVLQPVARFLGNLLTYAYGGSAMEVKDDKPKIEYDDMVIQWDRSYDLTFPFNICHGKRPGIVEEVYRKTSAGHSVLDQERAVTSLMSVRHDNELSRCASPAFRLTMSSDSGLIVLTLENREQPLHIFRDLIKDFRWGVTASVERFLAEHHPSFTVVNL